MVFHVIPNVQLEGIGAVACSETVLVTDQGREVLTGGIEDTFIVTRK
jgi:Xaa-Pro aminopeptidase